MNATRISPGELGSRLAEARYVAGETLVVAGGHSLIPMPIGLTHALMPHDHWRVWETAERMGLHG